MSTSKPASFLYSALPSQTPSTTYFDSHSIQALKHKTSKAQTQQRQLYFNSLRDRLWKLSQFESLDLPLQPSLSTIPHHDQRRPTLQPRPLSRQRSNAFDRAVSLCRSQRQRRRPGLRSQKREGWRGRSQASSCFCKGRVKHDQQSVNTKH